MFGAGGFGAASTGAALSFGFIAPEASALALGAGNPLGNMGINHDSIPEPMGTCVEKVWFRTQNPWEINSFLAFVLSRVVGKG